MPRSPAARRYARALFDLAQEQGRQDAVAADRLFDVLPLQDAA